MSRCFHCESNPAKVAWLNPNHYCPACALQIQEPEDPAYTPGLIRSRLQTLLTWREAGLRRGSHVSGLVELADLENAIRTASDQQVLTSLEVNVLTCRLIQGHARRHVAELMGVSESTITRAVKSASRKLAVWLNRAPVSNGM